MKVWKLGDTIHSSPTVVAAPQERYDVIYGDTTYTDYFKKYKDRRQVVYVGANDGMLHAFNGGFYHRGDDPATTASNEVEHGWFTTTASGVTNTPPLGDELWGFIPQELLPHLRWLTQGDYTHVYYVDLKPKVTDARIFTPDAAHPNGWGTILIGGFRLGGSCGNCPAGDAPPMSVTADFDNNAGTPDTTRTFYSAYFVLDITDPEQDPTLLWSFSQADVGLTTNYPTVVRVNPSTKPKTDNSIAKWFITFGTGPTSYDADSAQASQMFALEMSKPWSLGSSLVVSTFPTGDATSFMGDVISLDADLDYRVDTLYQGNVINNGSNPDWAGKLYRLTTGDPTDSDTFG
ncbi:hypothetical protein MYX04_14085, partial [Nitrospiraceae bacterium AH_259_D15_M11_P09]|nr:hypothetical protein [Nitrospiraceae bacterium AH_259_D15_M11_P09]